MKVLVLGRGLPGPRQELLGIFEFQQARALAGAGHEVVYAALDIRFLHHRRPWGVRRSTVDGVPVVELSLPLGRLQYGGRYRLVAAFWELLYRAAVRAHGRPDVVHSHFIGWSAAAAMGKRRHGYPLVVTEHTSGLMDSEPRPAMLRGIAIAYPAADVLIAVSPALRERIRELTGRDAVYVPNLVNVDAFAVLPRVPHDGRRLVSVGNLLPRKRMDLLIDALSRVIGDVSQGCAMADAELVIVGAGQERAGLERLAAARGLAESVRFTGALPHPRIAELFAASDVFALASADETFGVVLIEAMASGLPVVSTRSGGPEGFVTPETGVLTGHSVDEVAAGLRSALTRAWDHEAIRAYAVAHHSPAVVAAQLTELYDRAVSAHRS
ncbi:MAG: glycosyltransferase [Dermatophilaceae bacterium]